MLRLSPAQTQALAQAQGQTSFAQLAAHCRTYYPDAVSHLTDAALMAQLHHCHSRAQSYGLSSRRDLYRFVNLALSFGWEFDRDANLPWMRQYLTDPRVDSPAQRLELLVKYAIHRLEIEEFNRTQRQAFAPQEGAHQSNPYADNHEELEPFAPIASNLLFPNPWPSLWVDSDTEQDDDDDETELTEEDEDTGAPNEASYAEDDDEMDSAEELNLNGPSLLFNRRAR